MLCTHTHILGKSHIYILQRCRSLYSMSIWKAHLQEYRAKLLGSESRPRDQPDKFHWMVSCLSSRTFCRQSLVCSFLMKTPNARLWGRLVAAKRRKGRPSPEGATTADCYDVPLKTDKTPNITVRINPTTDNGTAHLFVLWIFLSVSSRTCIAVTNSSSFLLTPSFCSECR